MTKGIGIVFLLAVFALCLTVTFRDFYYGGMDASITGQVIMDTIEAIKELLASALEQPIDHE